jgi:hypothetical protein
MNINRIETKIFVFVFMRKLLRKRKFAQKVSRKSTFLVEINITAWKKL